MPAPCWTVSRLVRVWRLAAGDWIWLTFDDRLEQLQQQGGNRVAQVRGEWVVLPVGVWPLLRLVPPPGSKRSA